MPAQLPSEPIVVHRGSRRNVEARAFALERGFAVVARVEHGDNERSTSDDVPVVTFETWRKRFNHVKNIVTALDPAERRSITARIVAAAGVIITSRPRDEAVSSTVTFGEGTITGAGPLFIASLTTIGRHVILMTPISIGHDCVIGDFVTVHPSAAISGHVVVDDDVVIGAGAVIVNGLAARPLRIGRGTYVEAGAVVTKSVPAGVIVTGNPGRPLRHSVATHE